jgi:hypothetical protein
VKEKNEEHATTENEETLRSLATQRGSKLWLADREQIKKDRPNDFKNIQKLIQKFDKSVKYIQHERVSTTRKHKDNPTKTYTTHHLIDIKDLDKLRESLRVVWEIYCSRKPVKMMVMFSYLTETEHKNKDESSTYTHAVTESAVDTFFSKALLPIVVHNHESLEVFANYAIAQLGELMERTMQDTKTHIMCILEAFVACYSIDVVGSAIRKMKGKYNFCIFYAMTFHFHPEHMSNESREKLAMTYWTRFERITGKPTEIRKQAYAYPGFDLTDETKLERLMTESKFNIQTYVNEGDGVVIGEYYDANLNSTLVVL